MSKIGPYEQIQQLDAAGHVFTACKGAGASPQFVLKFQEDPKAAAALRSSAELQRIVSRKLPNWATVHEIGAIGTEGVFVVYDLYPASVKQIVDAKVSLTPQQLARISDQVAHAVAELSAQYGRAHGAINSSNVMLTDRDLSHASALLSDPAAQDSPAAGDTNADRRALGRLIFEMVTGLVYQDYFWPLRSSRKWDVLGADGAVWLEWTNRLLAPTGSPQACSLEKFRAEVEAKYRAAPMRKSKSPMKAVAVVLVLAFLAAGGGYWYFKIRPQLAIQAPSPTTQVSAPPTTKPVVVVAPPKPVMPSPAPTAPGPPPNPASIVQQQQELLAAQQAAQGNLDTEIINFAALADDMHTLAPDLYDFAADVQTARNVSLSPGDTVAEIQQYGQEALSNVRDIRRIAIHQALANARKFTFKHAAITQAFAGFAATQQNTEDALRPMAAEIGALKQLDQAWSDDMPLPPDEKLTPAQAQSIAGVYSSLFNPRAEAAVKAVVKNPSAATGAIQNFVDQQNKLRQNAAIVARQFEAVGDANQELNSNVYPPSESTWDALQKELVAAGPTPAGWPDANLADAIKQVNQVLAALRCNTIDQLQTYAAAGGPPPLMLALCAKFPALHGDADQDASVFESLKANTRTIPPGIVHQLGDLWVSRITAETDPAKAAHLLDLANTIGLSPSPRELATDYYNSRLSDLKSHVTAQQSADEEKQAIQKFIDQTKPTADPSWPLADAEKQTAGMSDASLAAALNPPPPTRLSSEFQLAADGSGDYLYVPTFDPGHPMRFKRLHNKINGTTFYLCTTEATVGWFIGMFNDPHRQIVLRHLLDFTVPQKLCGPSAWRNNFIRSGIEINRDRSWLAFSNHNWDADDSLYVPSGDGPSSLTPMQYVSPLASMYAAWLVGCRLPTVDEWQSAYESNLRDGDDNCSGGNWSKLRASINGLTPPDISSQTCHKFRSELGIETPDGQPILSAGSARSDPSDVLWFRGVPSASSTFHDLRGNVAEWVLTAAQDQPPPRLDSDEPITVADESGSHAVTNQDDAALSTFYSHCQRIGLTSISGRDDDPEKPAAPADTSENRHHQYFDVGFRLAMNDPATPAVPNLVLIVQRLQPVAP
jgi:formylglycine-generating enzyme required for sulfatase activity